MIVRHKPGVVFGVTMCEAQTHLARGEEVHVYAYGMHWGEVTEIIKLRDGHWYVGGEFGRFRPESYTHFIRVYHHDEPCETRGLLDD